MSRNVHFSVDTRLTRLLSETYRSSELALKELVDNAWDADALNVWVSLPDPMTTDPITIKDDGVGMTEQEILSHYLNIASDRRRRSGEKTAKYQRQIKGRKGIGKFAGLMIANRMELQAFARGRRCILQIDKQEIINHQNDLETVPLPLVSDATSEDDCGTTIVLSELDNRLNFPNPDRLREILIYEYGREERFKVFVNGVQLSVEDVPGSTRQLEQALPTAGNVKIRFTVADGKRLPKMPGIVFKVDGKVVGKPTLIGLDEDEEIPTKLARRVYGEVELRDFDEHVTADWGGIVENSKAFEEVQAVVRTVVKEQLRTTYADDMKLQKARLQKQINQRLQQLPEHRRRFAQEAVYRILNRFYGESEERIAIIAEVALDAMEYDAYWMVLEQIGLSSYGDIDAFASSLENFGFLELSRIGAQAQHRLKFLDYLEQLIQDRRTLEKDVHKALESNLWVLGRKYSLISSNKSLRSIIESYCNESFKGNRASKRPDLLLSQDYGDTYLLIEFKRPSHPIGREDIAQAHQYRDDLSAKLSSTKKMEVMMVGSGRVKGLDTHYLDDKTTIHSYVSIISAARNELDWLLSSFSKE
jgi:hypothetical protein